MIKNERAAQAKMYRDASAVQQKLLRNGTPEEIAQAMGRVCPFCLNLIVPKVATVTHAHPPRLLPIFPDFCGCPAEQIALADESQRRNKVLDKDAQALWRSSLQRAGLVGWLSRATFDNYGHRADWPAAAQAEAACREYAQALLHKQLGEKSWLVLHGNMGCGKSHLAAAVCHEALGRGMDHVFFRPWGAYLDRLMATFDRTRFEPRTSDVMAELQYGRLVCIDDMDKVVMKSWAEGKLFTVLNHRYNACLPTIVTLNSLPETMAGPIGDRLRGAAFDLVFFDGPSFRGLA